MANEKRMIYADMLLGIVNEIPDRNMNGVTIAVAIAQCPTVDAVEVVRCKDCISYKPYYLPGLHKNDNRGICDRYPFLSEDHKFRTETDFCSYGERKDNG